MCVAGTNTLACTRTYAIVSIYFFTLKEPYTYGTFDIRKCTRTQLHIQRVLVLKYHKFSEKLFWPALAIVCRYLPVLT